jgi:hypothetical protein
VPGPLGWVLLGALALGIWGGLLRKNAQQLAGPVSVLGDGKDDKLVKVLRVAVLRNLDEPGAAPGASPTNPVTNLLDVVGGPVGQISKILDVVYKIAGRRYGYEVATDVTPADQPGASAASVGQVGKDGASDGPTTVLVKLKSIVGERTLASQVFTRATAEQAVRTAGLWAAGQILQMSSRVPSWAAWNAHTAEALSTAFAEDPALPQLEAAVKDAPGSGLLLAMLGHRYELAGRRFDAIDMYARAVAAHPRYLVARYRLGAALAGLRDDAEWQQSQALEREALLRSLQRAAVALHISVLDLTAPAKGQLSQQELFMNLARRFLDELRVDTRLWHRLVCAFRRSERDSVAPLQLIQWGDPGARFHPVVKSVCLAYAPAKDFDAGKLIGYASRPRRWWQVSYNAACGLAYQLPLPIPPDHPDPHEEMDPARAAREEQRRARREQERADRAGAIASQTDVALRMLEQSLLKPGIEQLNANWVTEDVDLDRLHGNARFGQFVRQLRTGA